ncbi:MAG: hypothetical protein GX933_10210 [Chloroflexi bacterium]|jgi:hypothetical protein|nr:hypothetical protein [Chloroflexota bacterium]
MNNEKQGCLSAILKLFLLRKAYDWAEQKFGYGNGIFGCGCGCLLTILFIVIALSIIFNTNFLKIGF